MALAQKVRGVWKENVYAVGDLIEILPAYYGAADVYISQNRFRRWRGVNRVAALSSMYADLDFYNRANLAGMHVLGVLHVAMEELEKGGLPRPSYAMSTGRGLALVWLHRPVSAKELPKWNLCQAQIWQTLRDVGADRAATDAARVLRVAGTVNSKSGSLVETLWEDLDHVWDFTDLAGEILPPNPQSSKPVRDEVPRNEAAKPRRAASAGSNLSVRSLNRARLRDLRKLLEIRSLEKLPRGKRDVWLLIASSCMSRLMAPDRLEKEVYKLARDVADWDEAGTRSQMQPVFDRAGRAAKGETVEWEGLSRDPRYRFTNKRIIEMLDISPDEERQLETIISASTKRERERARQAGRRQKRGMISRSNYLEQADNKRRLVVRLHNRGYSKARIAQQTGYSARHVSRIIADSE